MELYNTLSGKKELIKKSKKPLRLFVCGLTVYDTPHIGNARTYVMFDSFVRYMRSQKYAVTYLQNITDIDDKIIDRAQKENTSWKKIARTYEQLYHQNEKSLGITSVSTYARATDYIPEIVRQIQTLIKKGYAYQTDDGYYFDIKKFERYGQLSKRSADIAEQAVSRIDESITKRNKGDFALWKFSKEGEPSWKTPLGSGRPGWHIEDTAITEKFFGPQYDIHGGALDLKFPHHEAEIAQQEAASGKHPLVRMWMHAGFLLVNGKKMSKSLGNFISINDFLKEYHPLVFRHMVLTHHYRSPMDYTEKLVAQSIQTLASLQKFIWKVSFIQTHTKNQKQNAAVRKILTNTQKEFHNALADDFNTPQALASIFLLLTSLESHLTKISSRDALTINTTILSLLETIGISLLSKSKIPASIQRISTKRELARSYKQFMQADVLRNKIHQLGYIIDDTPWGPLVMPKNIFTK